MGTSVDKLYTTAVYRDTAAVVDRQFADKLYATAVYRDTKAGYTNLAITDKLYTTAVYRFIGVEPRKRRLQNVNFYSAVASSPPITLALTPNGAYDLNALDPSTPVGTDVATIVGVDPESDPLTYTLSGSVPFEIVGDQLRVLSTLPPSTAQTFDITADDGNGSPTTETFTVTTDTLASSVAPPPVSAEYAAVIDVTAGTALYGKGSLTQTASHMAASLSKMATAVLLVRRKASVLDSETATVTSGDLVVGTSASLTAGDVLTWRDLLYGLMLPSGNDAAETIARVIGAEMYADAGSTGTTNRTRFIEAMNALAVELGMVDTTFGSPHGVSYAPSGYTSGSNITTATDMCLLAREAFGNSTIRTVAASASRLVTITGANARTYTVNHTSEMQSDANVLAGKGGDNGSGEYSLAILWQAPNGNEIVATVIGSTASADRYLDMRGILYEIVQDYPYLDDGVAGTDAQFANVVFLAGGDSGFTDESSYARTLTANGGVTRSTDDPLFGTHSFLFDGTDDNITAPDAAELSMGTGDFAVEFWMRGNGSEPGAFTAFVSKWDTTGNQREWSIQYDPSTDRLVLFASTTGSDFPETLFDLSLAGMTPNVFFNGAKRHILARRSGTELSLYVNGVKGGTNYAIGASSLFNGTSKMVLGARQLGSGIQFPFAGKLDEIRVTKGNARQTAAKFTPSVKKFPRSA